MSVHVHITVFFLVNAILSIVDSQTVIQQYVIRRDFFTFSKASEFTVFDTKEKHIHYRIESRYDILQNIKLIAYPSKKEIGRLNAKINLLFYKAEFSIVDPRSNQAVSGLIAQDMKFLENSYSIVWGGHRISMIQELGTFSSVFRDSDSGEILAQFRLRPASLLWTRKYDMKIFSNKYPEEIYLFGLVARDRASSRN